MSSSSSVRTRHRASHGHRAHRGAFPCSPRRWAAVASGGAVVGDICRPESRVRSCGAGPSRHRSSRRYLLYLSTRGTLRVRYLTRTFVKCHWSVGVPRARPGTSPAVPDPSAKGRVGPAVAGNGQARVLRAPLGLVGTGGRKYLTLPEPDLTDLARVCTVRYVHTSKVVR